MDLAATPSTSRSFPPGGRRSSVISKDERLPGGTGHVAFVGIHRDGIAQPYLPK